MMLDWNDYQEQLLVMIGNIAKLSPDTVRGYGELSGTAWIEAEWGSLTVVSGLVDRNAFPLSRLIGGMGFNIG